VAPYSSGDTYTDRKISAATSLFCLLPGKVFQNCIIRKLKAAIFFLERSQDGVVDVATSYGLDGPEFESRKSKKIISSPKQFRTALALIQLSIQQVPKLFPGGVVARALNAHLHPARRLSMNVAIPLFHLYALMG